MSMQECGNICRRMVGSMSCVFKKQNPMKHFSAGRKKRGNALEQNKTTNKEEVRVVSTMCLRTIALSQNLMDSVGNTVV